MWDQIVALAVIIPCGVLFGYHLATEHVARMTARALDTHTREAIDLGNDTPPDFVLIRDRLIAEGDWPTLVLNETTEEVTWK